MSPGFLSCVEFKKERKETRNSLQWNCKKGAACKRAASGIPICLLVDEMFDRRGCRVSRAATCSRLEAATFKKWTSFRGYSQGCLPTGCATWSEWSSHVRAGQVSRVMLGSRVSRKRNYSYRKIRNTSSRRRRAPLIDLKLIGAHTRAYFEIRTGLKAKCCSMP